MITSKAEASCYRSPGSALRPRWRSVFFSLTLAGLTLSILPFFEFLAGRGDDEFTIRPAPDVAAAPPPAEKPPPRRPAAPREKPRPKLAQKRPRLEKPRQRIGFLKTQLSLSMTSLHTGLGDYSLDFDVAPEVSDERPANEPLVFQMAQLDSPPREIVRMQPLYPRAARQKRVEGFVELTFVITREGRVVDIEIVRSEPAGVFEATAKEAVARWRFSRPLRGGESVAVRARQVVRFQLQ